MRSGDDLKKLENLSSCREVHMYEDARFPNIVMVANDVNAICLSVLISDSTNASICRLHCSKQHQTDSSMCSVD